MSSLLDVLQEKLSGKMSKSYYLRVKMSVC